MQESTTLWVGAGGDRYSAAVGAGRSRKPWGLCGLQQGRVRLGSSRRNQSTVGPEGRAVFEGRQDTIVTRLPALWDSSVCRGKASVPSTGRCREKNQSHRGGDIRRKIGVSQTPNSSLSSQKVQGPGQSPPDSGPRGQFPRPHGPEAPLLQWGSGMGWDG